MLVAPVDPLNPDPEILAQAVAALRRSEIVAVPTDTLYGLAVDPRDRAAVERLFAIKGREADRAVPLVAADLAQVEAVFGRLPAAARRLADRFWPGPLTLVVDGGEGPVAANIGGGTGTVAVRVPAHAVPRRLAGAAGHPLTATSANRSGQPAATSAAEIVATLGVQVAVILDAGPAPGGLPSTVVDARGERPRLVREGAVPWDRVLQFLE